MQPRPAPRPVVRRKKKSKNLLKAFFILVVTVAGTAAISFGGLAAWSVTTQNNGSTYATGTVHHSNQAIVGSTGVSTTCNDTTSPGSCSAVFTLANAKPGSSTSGTVKITNTGTLQSTFTLGIVSAVTSGAGATLCGNLNVTIVDNQTAPATVYNGALTVAGFGAAKPIRTGGASPSLPNSLNWNATDNGTYTFTVSLPVSVLSDMGSTCTAAFIWTQTNT